MVCVVKSSDRPLPHPPPLSGDKEMTGLLVRTSESLHLLEVPLL